MISPIITYGYSKDIPFAPAVEIKTKKNHYSWMYTRSEFNPDCVGFMPIGWRYRIHWYSFDGSFHHTEEWNTIADDRSVEDMIDKFAETYGKGRLYVFADEIVTHI